MIEGAEIAGGGPLPHQALEIGDRIAPDLLLRLRIGLRQVAPMDLRDRARPHLPPDMIGRQDVEEGEPLDAARMVEGEPIRHARAAIMPDDGEMHMAERFHDLDHVAAHGALGIGLVLRIALRRGRPAIAAQIHADDAMGLGQRRREVVPHGMGLRKAVQQNQRLAGCLSSGRRRARPPCRSSGFRNRERDRRSWRAARRLQ